MIEFQRFGSLVAVLTALIVMNGRSTATRSTDGQLEGAAGACVEFMRENSRCPLGMAEVLSSGEVDPETAELADVRVAYGVLVRTQSDVRSEHASAAVLEIYWTESRRWDVDDKPAWDIPLEAARAGAADQMAVDREAVARQIRETSMDLLTRARQFNQILRPGDIAEYRRSNGDKVVGLDIQPVLIVYRGRDDFSSLVLRGAGDESEFLAYVYSINVGEWVSSEELKYSLIRGGSGARLSVRIKTLDGSPLSRDISVRGWSPQGLLPNRAPDQAGSVDYDRVVHGKMVVAVQDGKYLGTFPNIIYRTTIEIVDRCSTVLEMVVPIIDLRGVVALGSVNVGSKLSVRADLLYDVTDPYAGVGLPVSVMTSLESNGEFVLRLVHGKYRISVSDGEHDLAFKDIDTLSDSIPLQLDLGK